MHARALIAVLAGCGRIGFDPLDGGASVGPGSTLSLDRVDPGEELDDFPLLVVLDDTRADRTRFALGATNLRFFAASGQLLPNEIEQAGAVGGAPTIAWVRVPAIIGLTTTLTVTYAADPIAPSGEPTWSSDYLAVWHFATGGTAIDSAGNNDATPARTSVSPGMIGNGRSLDAATKDFLFVPDSSAIVANALTLEAWMNPTAATAQFYGALSRQAGTATPDDLYLGIHDGAAFTEFSSETSLKVDTAGGSISVGAWNHLVATADMDQVTVYLDGAQVGFIANGSPLTANLAGAVYMGADRDGNGPADTPDTDFLSGSLDELRIEDAVRDGAWVAYDDVAQRDQVITYDPSN